MNSFKQNAGAWGLIVLGLITMAYAHHVGFDKLEVIGGGFISAALYAFQHTPDGPASPKV